MLSATSGSSTASQITYTILSLPTEGVLNLGGTPAQIGTTFSQADIDNLQLEYSHTSPVATNDLFVFDILTAGGGWIHADTFHISAGLVGNHPDFTNQEEQIILIPNPTLGELTIRMEVETGFETGHLPPGVPGCE